MASETSLSVVIPVMNEEDSIGILITEINSALNEYPRFEIVIVDDGSSDQTLAMALVKATGGLVPPRP